MWETGRERGCGWRYQLLPRPAREESQETAEQCGGHCAEENQKKKILNNELHVSYIEIYSIYYVDFLLNVLLSSIHYTHSA